MEDFKEILNDYYNAWNQAFKSKDEKAIRAFMSKHFVGYWGRSGMESPYTYDYNYDIKSVLNQYDNAVKSIESEAIKYRKEGEEIVVNGTETNLINGTTNHAVCMLVWRKEGDEWKILREYIELEK
ncbi:nuclear transport factor 2 family protein [Pseudalkalibacillus caeni]|uniref:Nuclear transport factor 2 family protein n=1 Tax=Exobacillus caeni TaxID=2574798 RepID=A0A5R9F5I9_9BACL|nr:nuclear transport factor 2 family protein [Pseudalkalibacillus caeni]TLS36908.1 nuclear transport factor 2 family protein [Pseudalkalibacillus caeni]